MSNLQIIAWYEEKLTEALRIIREQAEMMALHGIWTETGELEEERNSLLEEIEKEGLT